MIRTVTVKYHRVPLQLGYNNRELTMFCLWAAMYTIGMLSTPDVQSFILNNGLQCLNAGPMARILSCFGIRGSSTAQKNPDIRRSPYAH